MKGVLDIIRYLGTFVAILLFVVALGGLYNSLNNRLTIFEGAAISLLSVGIILLLTLYYRVERLALNGRKRR